MNNDIITLVSSSIVLILIIVVCWKIVKKTGASGFFSLLIFVPIANLLYILYLSFSKWPIERELEEYKKKYGELNEKTEDFEITICPYCTTPRPNGAEKCIICGFDFSNIKE